MENMDRRDFIRTAAAASAGAVMVGRAFGQAANAPSDTLNIAVIGAGTQARDALMLGCYEMDDVRIRAICDIWDFSQRYASRKAMAMYRSKDHEDWSKTLNTYKDYREMLEKEKDLDAVIVATPDFMHHEHTIACLEAGLNVYCEKEMSNSLENARKMAETAARTGKLLQIGHQRRSNPVYRYALELLRDQKICGQQTYCYGQWNRGVQPLLTWHPRYEMAPEELRKYGYENMQQFRNWRWYRAYSAGPIADLGSHQIDIFSWFLGCNPTRVIAMGGSDYFGDREWYEDVLCTYEYEFKKDDGGDASARAFYQVLNTNSTGHYYERFSGDGGSLTISENPKKCYFIPEPGKAIPDWMEKVERVTHDGHPNAVPLVDALKARDDETAAVLTAFETKAGVHQVHLENFLAAVRAGDKSMLNCPPEIGYETAVAVLNVIPAVEAGGGYPFKDGEFHV